MLFSAFFIIQRVSSSELFQSKIHGSISLEFVLYRNSILLLLCYSQAFLTLEQLYLQFIGIQIKFYRQMIYFIIFFLIFYSSLLLKIQLMLIILKLNSKYLKYSRLRRFTLLKVSSFAIVIVVQIVPCLQSEDLHQFQLVLIFFISMFNSILLLATLKFLMHYYLSLVVITEQLPHIIIISDFVQELLFLISFFSYQIQPSHLQLIDYI